MINKNIFPILALLILSPNLLKSQPLSSINEGKHQKVRTLRYMPDGEDFVIINGDKKFNRALYGGHSGFRVETGDVPEFAFYLPRMGGNLSFEISNGENKIQLNNTKWIESRYRPGKRLYSITDPILGKGKIEIEALALYDVEGAIWKITSFDLPKSTVLHSRFGGASMTGFSRSGDMGVDPEDGFELKDKYCDGNKYNINDNKFELSFGADNQQFLFGVMPDNSKITTDYRPALNSEVALKGTQYIYIGRDKDITNGNLEKLFEETELRRKELASRITISTPDPFFNTIGGALSVAADGIWDGDVWLHGAIGWRMQLTGWRAGYTGDFLGWHDRARTHFDNYANSQVADVPQSLPHPAQDEELNLARSVKKWGTPHYSNGYICRNPNKNNQMHHYNMNLCYIDELLWHLNWTGDLDYARKMWPVITRHLAWEKLNYDPNDDGLYDAYACIWASDALYYNSGAVTHSTAYNYRSNRLAALIAEKIGEDPTPYQNEAEKIDKAINEILWLQDKGHWAEYKDFMGLKRTHEKAAVWSIYHAIDSEVGNSFQRYQATQYIDNEIPHIPVRAIGLIDDNYQTISTTNWFPYSWSVNNVAFAEVMHTALAYFQTGRNEKGYKLLKSSILDGMYLGGSPGNFGQVSFYDAARGECYRDFADPIGVASRVFIQGLYGINPDALNKRIVVKPGFPKEWGHANIKTPDLTFDYLREDTKDSYILNFALDNINHLELQIVARYDKIKNIRVNGVKSDWIINTESIGKPMINIGTKIEKNKTYNIEVEWDGNHIEELKNTNNKHKPNDIFQYKSKYQIIDIKDPQEVLHKTAIDKHNDISGIINGKSQYNTIFVRLASGDLTWWDKINIEIEHKEVLNYSNFSNVESQKCETINIDRYFNSNVTDIFNNKYLTPRSPYTTLQLPTQGIGEWCHPNLTAEINDTGLRSAIENNVLKTNLGIDFRTPNKGKNIVYTSLWNNYPDADDLKLSGKATHAYLMMAGSTNHMQCHIANGVVTIHYMDESSIEVELINPDNWCPIEQDYFVDDLAFNIKGEKPYRIHLNSGLVSNNLEKDLNITGVYGRSIDGGAGVLLDIPLDSSKELSHLSIRTLSNDVIIGLMSVTLQRP